MMHPFMFYACATECKSMCIQITCAWAPLEASRELFGEGPRAHGALDVREENEYGQPTLTHCFHKNAQCISTRRIPNAACMHMFCLSFFFFAFFLSIFISEMGVCAPRLSNLLANGKHSFLVIHSAHINTSRHHVCGADAAIAISSHQQSSRRCKN